MIRNIYISIYIYIKQFLQAGQFNSKFRKKALVTIMFKIVYYIVDSNNVTLIDVIAN